MLRSDESICRSMLLSRMFKCDISCCHSISSLFHFHTLQFDTNVIKLECLTRGRKIGTSRVHVLDTACCVIYQNIDVKISMLRYWLRCRPEKSGSVICSQWNTGKNEKKDTKVDLNPTKQEMKFNTLRNFLSNEAQCWK